MSQKPWELRWWGHTSQTGQRVRVRQRLVCDPPACSGLVQETTDQSFVKIFKNLFKKSQEVTAAMQTELRCSTQCNWQTQTGTCNIQDINYRIQEVKKKGNKRGKPQYVSLTQKKENGKGNEILGDDVCYWSVAEKRMRSMVGVSVDTSKMCVCSHRRHKWYY